AMTEMLGRVVDSKAFQNAVLGIILLAAIVVGLETSYTVMDAWGPWVYALDNLILWLFVVEAAMKMARHGRRFYRYFYEPWNVFDFTIIAVCFMPIGGHYAAVLRLARVLRALRLVSNIPKLQLLVGSLLKSLPSMFYVGILLTLLFYVYGVLGVFLFRENDPVHFGDLGRSLLTLFRVVTLEDWTDVMYLQMYGSDVYQGFNHAEVSPVESRAMPVVAVTYFVSFVMLGTMIMLNLFIGVIISSMDEAQAEEERKLRRQHIAATGEPTVKDELLEIRQELEAMTRRVQGLAKKSERG
ncbi:MAG: ion transporter, partial [Planctomycetota bacterium]